MSRPAPDLRVYWSRRERDILYCFQNRDAKALASILSYVLETLPAFKGNSFRKELENRGYDITTLRISVRRKAEGGESR